MMMPMAGWDKAARELAARQAQAKGGCMSDGDRIAALEAERDALAATVNELSARLNAIGVAIAALEAPGAGEEGR
jgi:uncharacterized protein YhaN